MALTQESTDTHCDESREARLAQPELPERQLGDTDEGLRVMPFRGFSIYQEWAKKVTPPVAGLLFLVLGACRPAENLTPIIGHAAGKPCNTGQPCLAESAFVPAADLALVILAHEAVAAGHPYAKTAAAVRRPLICLVQSPEPCCAYGSCQVDSDGVVRDKAGCAIPDGALWVSKEWPKGTVRDWRPDLLHEMGHLVAAALLVPQRRDHQDAWKLVEARAQTAFSAVLGASR